MIIKATFAGFAATVYFLFLFASSQQDSQTNNLIVEVGGNQVNSISSSIGPESTPSEAYVGIKRVYPNLRFDRPVLLTGSGDGSGRMFVVEQAGVIRVFQGTADDQQASTIKTSEVFLDISSIISRHGNEEGLLGLAFHPDFKNNGQFFVHYSSERDSEVDQKGQPTAAPNIISRFNVSADNPNRADETSEEIILKQPQPYRNHNGGTIAFGPDGFLYITFGDGGYANDPHGHGQNLQTLLGSIIRIDVDKKDDGLAYAIPSDNPFVGQNDTRPELWAFGLRNVWRFSFDRKTGEMYAADVGQDKIEEVNVIVKGGNYGWNRFEANADFNIQTELSTGEHIGPVAFYEHSWGISITGGNVYRGNDHPELDGKYFYGDYVSGNLWSLTKTDDGQYKSELVRRTGRSIATFGEDDRGELYLLSFDGGIYKIISTDQPENTFENWPRLLSETGLYKSTKEKSISSKLIPYEVNAPFWSDGADKGRYVRLPEDTKIGFSETGAWQVPVGTTLVKNFEGQQMGRSRMFETRLIKRTSDGWESATYVWNKDASDADLLPAGKQFELYNRSGITSWHAPSSSECASCHVDAAGYVLGLNTAQLNREVAGENQILAWSRQGILELPADFDLSNSARFASPFVEPDDTNSTVTLEERARVYLDVNCAMCHQPNGPGNAKIDLRFATSLEQSHMINEPPAQGSMEIADAKIVSPGQPDNSLLLHRMETLGSGRMPTLGSNVIDEQGIKLIREWIESLKLRE